MGADENVCTGDESSFHLIPTTKGIKAPIVTTSESEAIIIRIKISKNCVWGRLERCSQSLISIKLKY